MEIVNKYLRIHALPAATQHNIRSFLGLLLFLQKSNGAQRSVTAAHLLQQLQENKQAKSQMTYVSY